MRQQVVQRPAAAASPTSGRPRTHDGAILNLQRKAGNQAVARLLRGTPEPSPGKPLVPGRQQNAGRQPALQEHPGSVKRPAPKRPPLPARPAAAVQRMVGFECEDAFWKAWRKYPVVGLRPVRRGEVLHTGTGFRMEGDDSEGADKPSVEFVTDPFPVSAPGVGQLDQAFAEIEGIMARLGQFSAGRDGSLQNKKSKEFVKGYQHGLGQTLWFSQGRPNARFKLQATHGTSLEELPVIMEYLGTNVPGETPVQGADRAGARQLMYPGGNPAFRNAEIANLIGAAPSLADQAIARLQASPHLTVTRRASFAANTGALRGFLAQVILYLKGLSAPESGPTQAKYLVPLLGRTSFATIFNLIPDDAHKRRLRRNHASALVDAVVEGANHQAFLHDASGTAIDTGFAAGSPLIRDLKPTGYVLPILTSLTVQNWVEGFATGTDYLSPSTMEAWLNANTTLTAQESKDQASYLESFSVLGKNQSVQSTHTDPSDIAGHTALSVYENRLIHGKTYFTAPEAHDAAFKYLQFFLDLKNAGGVGGTYPAAAAPNAPVAAGGGKLKYVDPTSLLGYFRL